MLAIRFRSAAHSALLLLAVVVCACVIGPSPVKAALERPAVFDWGAALSLPGVADASYDIDVAAGAVNARFALEFSEELGREFLGSQGDTAVWQHGGAASPLEIAWEPPDGEMVAFRCVFPLDALRDSGRGSELHVPLVDPATGEELELTIPVEVDFGLLLPAVKFIGVEPDEIDVADPTQPLALRLVGEGFSSEILPYIEISALVIGADGSQGLDICDPCNVALGSATMLRLDSDVPAGAWESADSIAIHIENLSNNDNWDFNVPIRRAAALGSAGGGVEEEAAELFDSFKLGPVNGGLELAVGEGIAITDGTIDVALRAAGGLLTEGMEFDSVEVRVDPAAAKQFPSLTFEVDEVEVGKGQNNLRQISLACHAAQDTQPQSWAMFAGFPASWDPASVKPGTTIPLIMIFEHQGAESRVPVRVPLKIGDEILPPVLRTFIVDRDPPVVTFDAAAGRLMEEEGIFYFELTGENLTKIGVGDIILSIGGEDCDDSNLSFAKIDQAVASLNARIDSQRLLQMLLNSGNFDPTARGPRQTVSLDSSLTLGDSKLSTPASIMVDVSGPPAVLIGLLLPAVQKVRAAETSELPFELEFQGEGLSPEFLGGISVAAVSIGGVSLPASSFVFSPPDSTGKGRLLLLTGGGSPAENTEFWLACCNGTHIAEATLEMAMNLPDGSSQTAEATIEFEWPQAAIRSATANCPEELVLDETGVGSALCELVLEMENMTQADLEACTVEVSSPGAPVLEWTFEKGWPSLSEPVTGPLASTGAKVHAIHRGHELPNFASGDEVELNFTITGPDGSSVNASSNIRVRLTELETVLKSLGLLSVSALTQETGGTVDVSLSLEGDNLPTGEEAQKMWLPANFRFEIGNLQGRVAKIDSFTIKQATATQTDFDITLSDLDLPQGYDRATPLLVQCVCIPRIGQEVVVDFEIPVEIEGTPKTPSLARGECTATVGDFDGDGMMDVVVVAHVSGNNLEGLAKDDFEVSLELEGVINPDPDFDMVFEGPEELLFNFATQPLESTHGTGGGGGAGKVMFSLRDSTADPVEVDFSFAKEYDKSTPKLAEAVCTGRVVDLDGDGWPEVEVTAAVSGQGMGKVSMQDFHFTCVIDGVEAEAVGDPTLEPGEAEITLKRTFVLPHVLESSGRIAADGSFSFDTTIFIVYVPDGQEVSDEITLAGQVTKKMMGAPKIGEATARAVVVDLDGDGWPEVETTAQVSGQGMGKVSMQDFHFTCQIDGVEAEAVGDPQITPGDTELELKRTFVLPHVLERDGRIAADGGFSFDTTLFIVYVPDGQQTSADTLVEGIVKQYDKATPKLAEAVCKGRVADLDGDGWPEVEMTATVSGQGMGKVSMQDFHFTCQIGGVEAEAVGDPQITPGDTELELKRTFVLPHVLERDGGIAADGSFSFDTTIFITYLPDGQEVSADTIVEGIVKQYDKATPKLAEAVCKGRVADVDGDGRLDIAFECTVGGEDCDDLDPARLTIDADCDGQDLALQGFVVNAHTNGFDLSCFAPIPDELLLALYAHGTGGTFRVTLVADPTQSVEAPYQLAQLDKELDKMAPRLASVACSPSVGDFDGDGILDLALALDLTGENLDQLAGDDLGAEVSFADGSVVPAENLHIEFAGGSPTAAKASVISDGWQMLGLLDTNNDGRVIAIIRSGVATGAGATASAAFSLAGLDKELDKMAPRLADVDISVGDLDGDGAPDLACVVKGEVCDDANNDNIFVTCVLDGQPVDCDYEVSNARSSGFDLAVFGFDPQPIAAAAARSGGGGVEMELVVAVAHAAGGGGGAGSEVRKTFVLPHVLEKQGSIASIRAISVDPLDPATLEFGLVLEVTGTGLEGDASSRQKKWLPANFKLEIGNLPCGKVSKIEAFTIKQSSAQGQVGELPLACKVSVQDLSLMKSVDKSSPILMRCIYTGEDGPHEAEFELIVGDEVWRLLEPGDTGNVDPLSFRGGVSVAAGDVNGDGRADVILNFTLAGELIAVRKENVELRTLLGDGSVISAEDMLIEVIGESDTTLDMSATIFSPSALADATPRTDGEDDSYPEGDIRRTFVVPHVLEVSGDLRASLMDAAGLPLIAEAPFSLSIEPTKIEIPNLVSGGVRVATGDVNGDGRADVITALEVQVEGENLASLKPQDLQIFVNFGDGEEEVSLQGFVVNAHTSAFDLSVFGFEPQPLAASARKAGGEQQEYLKIEFSDLLVSSYSIAPGSPGTELQLPLDLASLDYLDPDDDGDSVPTLDEEFGAAVDAFHFADVVLDRAFRAGDSLQLNFHAGGLNVLMGDGSVRSISEVSPSAIAERFGSGPLTFGVDAQVEGKSLNFETQIDPSSESLSFDLLLPYVVGENPDLDVRLSSGGFLECFLTQYSIVSPRDAASGMPTGKRQHKPITITKEWDKATPMLMQALVSNESINELPSGEVELNFTVTGEGQNLDLMTSSFVITDPETGNTFPGTPQVLQSSDGAVQILIGLLLPAVQKVREAAARGGQPARYNFFEAWPCRWEGLTLGGESLPMEELSLNFSHGASSGGDRPTESLSLNFEEIKVTYDQASIQPTADGGAKFFGRCVMHGQAEPNFAPQFELVFPDGSSEPCTIDDMQITGGTVEILIGMLLPAVQKVREAAMGGTGGWQVKSSVVDMQGNAHTRFDPIMLDLSAFWSTSGDADDRPTEEVAFYYNKISWTWQDGGVTAEDDWETPVAATAGVPAPGDWEPPVGMAVEVVFEGIDFTETMFEGATLVFKSTSPNFADSQGPLQISTEGGMKHGRCDLMDIVVTKELDKSSPTLRLTGDLTVQGGSFITDGTSNTLMIGEKPIVFPPIHLDLTIATPGGGSGGEQPMESLSLNFTKIEFRNYPDGSTGLEGEFEFTGDPALLALLDGTSAEAESRKGWDGKVKGLVEFGGVDQAARKRPGLVKYGDITLKRGQMTIDATLSFILPYIEQDNWRQAGLDGARLEEQVTLDLATSSGDPIPTESLSLNFTKIEFRYTEAAVVPTADGGDFFSARLEYPDAEPRGQAPTFEVVFPDGSSMPCPVEDMQVTGGTVQILIGMLLPAVQKVREAAARSSSVEWQMRATVMDMQGNPHTRFDPIMLDLSAYQTGATSGDPIPTESISFNFDKITLRYEDGKVVPTADGGEVLSARVVGGPVPDDFDPHFELLFPDGSSMPCPIGELTITDGTVQILIGMLLPAVQKVRDAAARSSSVEWQMEASIIGEDGSRVTRFDPIALDLSAYQTGGSGGGSVPTESLSLNFTKIEFKYSPQKSEASGKTTGELELGWECVGLSEDELQGASWTLSSGGSGGEVSYLKYELENVLVSSYSSGDNTPIIRGIARFSDLSIDGIVLPEDGSTVDVPLVVCLLPAVQKLAPTCESITCKMGRVELAAAAGGHSQGGTVGPVLSISFPDVAKTPSPGGPIPIPYPNLQQGIAVQFEIDNMPPGSAVDSAWETCTGGSLNIEIADSSTGGDQFHTTTPGHKYVDTLTLRGPLTAGRKDMLQWYQDMAGVHEGELFVKLTDGTVLSAPLLLDFVDADSDGDGIQDYLDDDDDGDGVSDIEEEIASAASGGVEIAGVGDPTGLLEIRRNGADFEASLQTDVWIDLGFPYDAQRLSADGSVLVFDLPALAADGGSLDVDVDVAGVPFSSFELLLEGSDGGFTKISEIKMEIETIEFRDGMDRVVHKRPGRAKYSNIVLKRGMISDTALAAWAKSLSAGELLPAVLTLRYGGMQFQAGFSVLPDYLDDDDDGDGLSEDALLLMPALMKAKEKANRTLSSPLDGSGSFDPNGGAIVPTESLSLNFTKIIWSPKSNLRASLEEPVSGDLDLELEVVGDPLLLDLLVGAELELTCRKGWDGTIKGAIEFGETEPAARKRPGRVKYSNIVLKQGLVEPGSETSLDIETGLLLPAVSEARLGGSKELYQWWQDAAKGKNIRKNITVNLRRDASGDLQGFSSIDNAPEEKERGITINTSHVEYQSARLVDRAEPVLLITGLEFDVELVATGTPGEEIFPDKYSLSFGDGSVFPAEFTPSDPAGTARKAMGRMKCSDVTLERGIGTPSGNGIIAILIGLLADGTEVSTEVFIPLDEATASQWKEFSPAEDQLKSKPRNLADAGAAPDSGSPGASSDHNSSRSNKSSAAAPDPAGGGAGDDLLIGGTTTFDGAAAGDAAVEGVVPQTPGTYVFELVVADNIGLSSGHVSFGPEDRSALMNFTAEFVDGRYLLRAGVPLRFNAAINDYVDDMSFQAGLQSNPLFADKGIGGVNPIYDGNATGVSPAGDQAIFLVLNEGTFADLRCALVDTGDGALQLAVSLSEGDFPPEQVMFNPKEVGIDKSVPWQKGKSSRAAGDPAPTTVELALDLQISDPGAEYRVKVKFPWLRDEESNTSDANWARVSSLQAGPDRGFYYLPEVGDEVLVSFAGGDIDRPIIIGSIWNDAKNPPPTQVMALDSDALPPLKVVFAEAPARGQELFVIPVVMADGSLALIFSESETTDASGVEQTGLVANVLKARHETAKNAIGNIR